MGVFVPDGEARRIEIQLRYQEKENAELTTVVVDDITELVITAELEEKGCCSLSCELCVVLV